MPSGLVVGMPSSVAFLLSTQYISGAGPASACSFSFSRKSWVSPDDSALGTWRARAVGMHGAAVFDYTQEAGQEEAS